MEMACTMSHSRLKIAEKLMKLQFQEELNLFKPQKSIKTRMEPLLLLHFKLMETLFILSFKELTLQGISSLATLHHHSMNLSMNSLKGLTLRKLIIVLEISQTMKWSQPPVGMRRCLTSIDFGL